MFVIRWVVGRIILLLNFVFSPKSPKRSPELQAEVDASTQHLSLYQLPACPFCVKVRRAMKREGINVELRDINKNQEYSVELTEQGGKRKVPCLKIVDENQQATWLYESSDVVTYLKQFAR
jgi:glutaredoxin